MKTSRVPDETSILKAMASAPLASAVTPPPAPKPKAKK